jgi:hypothetical protein
MYGMTWGDIQRMEDGNPEPLSFTPGVDFDPSDPDEVETVGLAMDRDMASRIARLERKNADLRAALEHSEDH